MSSPGSLLLLSFPSPEAFFFILSVCVCFPFTQALLLKTCFVSVSFPCPPYPIFTFRGLCIPLFLLSRQLVKFVEISSSIPWDLFFSPPLQTTRRCFPLSYKDQTLTVDRTAGHFGQDREDRLRPGISTF
ncbi:hypothetical protein V8C34DRAFT_33434 [Trichoderma compactum]